MINWRHIVSLVNNHLFKTVAANADTQSDSPRCLILDDTDFVKTSTLLDQISLSKKIMSKIQDLDLLSVWVTFIDELSSCNRNCYGTAGN